MSKAIQSMRTRMAGFMWGVIIGLSFVVMAPIWIAQGIRAWWKIKE
jgi:hypothetical protein